jgi:hypothetical protein
MLAVEWPFEVFLTFFAWAAEHLLVARLLDHIECQVEAMFACFGHANYISNRSGKHGRDGLDQVHALGAAWIEEIIRYVCRQGKYQAFKRRERN